MYFCQSVSPSVSLLTRSCFNICSPVCWIISFDGSFIYFIFTFICIFYISVRQSVGFSRPFVVRFCPPTRQILSTIRVSISVRLSIIFSRPLMFHYDCSPICRILSPVRVSSQYKFARPSDSLARSCFSSRVRRISHQYRCLCLF